MTDNNNSLAFLIFIANKFGGCFWVDELPNLLSAYTIPEWKFVGRLSPLGIGMLCEEVPAGYFTMN